LTAARRRFDELGMLPWIELVDRLAAEVGDGFPDGLTARQVEVLRLLADGLTNAEIVSRLFISEHTVERHWPTSTGRSGLGTGPRQRPTRCAQSCNGYMLRVP
jgi:hypothetical protein